MPSIADDFADIARRLRDLGGAPPLSVEAPPEPRRKPGGCRAPHCTLLDRSDGRCCGWMESEHGC